MPLGALAKWRQACARDKGQIAFTIYFFFDLFVKKHKERQPELKKFEIKVQQIEMLLNGLKAFIN